MTTQVQEKQKQNGTAKPTTSTPADGKVTLSQAITDFKGGLAQRRDTFAPSLPSHIKPERFEQVVMTAVNLNPDLLKADRRSLYNACAKAASDGLLPDGRDGALVIFNTKDGEGWIKKVQWMPMVAGIIKKARQSGEIASLGARIVYQNEIDQNRFMHKVVDGIPKVDHDPILWGDRGKPVLVYSFVQFKDGMVDFEFLHADDVAKIREVSKSKDRGPWKDWQEEMWKKSAIRRHAKRLPISSELFDTIARDDEATEFHTQRLEAEGKLLSDAKAQFGGHGDIIELENNINGENPLARGKRLLTTTEQGDVADLHTSISEELETDAERAEWDAACEARMAE
jgi:recombination protein RecT